MLTEEHQNNEDLNLEKVKVQFLFLNLFTS